MGSFPLAKGLSDDFAQRVRTLILMFEANRRALEGGDKNTVSVVLFPEYALGRRPKDLRDPVVAEGLNDLLDATRGSSSLFCWGTGTFVEDGVQTNRGFLMHDGQILATFDKQNLFGQELNSSLAAGKRMEPLEFRGISVLALVCADLWFPEILRGSLTGKLDLVLAPAFTAIPKCSLREYAFIQWKSLAITRAKENATVVQTADWVGQPKQSSNACASGSTIIVDPSIKYENECPENERGIHVERGDVPLISRVDLQRLRDYKEYRRRRGLLP